jgi:carboxyl-terminal processing protease
MPGTTGPALAVACLAGVLLCAGCATTPKAPPSLTAEQRQRNVESFDYVWTTIRDKYWDPEFGGLDWSAVRDELRPAVEQATTMQEARNAMDDMVSRLGVSHFAIIPTEVYAAFDQPIGEGPLDGETGIDVRILNGQVVVTSVAQGSPAAGAGVHLGWVVSRIGDTDVAAKLRALTQELAGERYLDYILASAARRRLTGPVGETLRLEFLDGNDEPVQLELTLVEKRGWKTRFGYLPSAYVWIDVDTLAGDIGYVAFNAFLDPAHVMPAYNEAMKSFMDAAGIIIDLRGNGGGLGAMVMGMAGWLIADKSQHLGTVSTRDNELKLVVYPRPTTYSGPVVVLTDGLSVSAAEFFAGGLKDLGRACIIGSRTAGAALPSAIEHLPNGDGFQYVFANYVAAGGEALEGAGVAPDIEVAQTRAALLAGNDLVVEAAINWIRDQK